MDKQSASDMKNSHKEDLIQPAGMEKLKFEVGQEMGINPKAKNKKN